MRTAMLQRLSWQRPCWRSLPLLREAWMMRLAWLRRLAETQMLAGLAQPVQGAKSGACLHDWLHLTCDESDGISLQYLSFA